MTHEPRNNNESDYELVCLLLTKNTNLSIKKRLSIDI